MQLGYTWEKLTAAQLIGAAHDLRNAAMVIKHVGHYKGALVNDKDGRVCAVGAIEIATYKTYYATHPNLPDAFFYATGWDDPGAQRSEAAIISLAAMIPTGLCRECDPDRKCACGCGNDYEFEPFAVVTHYNDEHCLGGTYAMNMMQLAADNAEATAANKRKELVPA